MRVSERQAIADRIVQFYVEKANMNKFETNTLRSRAIRDTLYSIIRRYESTGNSRFRPKTGRKVTVDTPEVVKKVMKALVNTNRSLREVANKLGISKSYVFDIKEKKGIDS